VADFIHREFIPIEAHIKERASYFHRFGVLWTPTILIMDGEGHEIRRNEGYLPKSEFMAWLEMALARIAFLQKKWADAERIYARIAENHPETSPAPEALYWKGVCRYKGADDHAALGEAASALKEKYPGDLWTVKSSIWLH
jgi:hypothetical protein